jgi:Antitoxin VbhA
MSQAPKDTRSAAEKARDTAGIVGSLKHEGYVPTPEAEPVHQRVARGEITSEEAIRVFRDQALSKETELTAPKRRPDRA